LDDMRHLLLHHDNHDSEMPYLLGLMSFSQRPLSQLLDFWPQGYPEVSPSECMCMWSEATLKSKQNMFLACFATVKLFFPSPLWPDFAVWPFVPQISWRKTHGLCCWFFLNHSKRGIAYYLKVFMFISA
jgi:hypothetical protein